MRVYYHNETLFSEIYLEEITRQPEQAEMLASLQVLCEYHDYADTSTLATWISSYIHEVLAALGFNVKLADTDLTLLYPMGSADRPISLCYATLPGEGLDNMLLGRNWAEKTIRALRSYGLQWGILTNGKLWRIYHLDEATPYETYLEIDLEQILSDHAKEAYQIFHKFMKASNFSVAKDGKCQFDVFKQDSKDKIDYIEKELANALKQREEGGKGVLSDLCMGYVDELRRKGGYNLDDETLRRKIYHGAMLYMFRLLFLFYAEARGLLSDKNKSLLGSVKTDVRALHNGEQNPGGGNALWERLSAIFVDIDQTYNGGLFSPQESEFTQFIEETSVLDQYLAETLYNLTVYREKNGQDCPISYRDMSVRHLGTLYEGLLEHKLFITAEATEVRVTKGKIEFIPASRGGKLAQGHYLPAGAVYFAGDPSERKATGSYYTPEYIVDYIVRNTVGEKLQALKKDFVAQEKANLEALRRAVDADERLALAGLLEENALAFVREKVLTLSVLDPAMGSGHFLVNAANLIANFITEFLNDLETAGETPSGTATWRRWVVENCIYGVDLNPLAVELAKLALWILSMAKDQPLSFTNHHLKCGNSLVGARLEEIGNYPFATVQKEPRQLKMFERDPNFRAAVEDALAKARLIASRASTSLADVEEKKAWLAEIEADLQGYKAICNVHTGLYFGNQVDETDYTHLVDKRDFTRAFALEKPDQYFHWELEFPEVFLDLHSKNESGNYGFDVVVGNPPYGAEFSKIISEYLQRYFQTFVWPGESYIVFIEKGHNLLNVGGKFGFIIPDTYLSLGFSHSLRNYILRNAKIQEIVLLPNSIFSGVSVDTTLLITEKAGLTNGLHDTQVSIKIFSKKILINDLETPNRVFSVNTKNWNTKNGFLIQSDTSELSILSRIEHEKKILADESEMFYGIKVYQVGKGKPPQTEEIRATKPFTSETQITKEFLPFYDGKHIGRYQLHWKANNWLRYGPWLAEPRVPEKFEGEKLLIRKIVGETLIATYVPDTSYCNTLLYVVKLSKNARFSYKYLLGVLNSKLIGWYFRKKFQISAEDTFPQILIRDIMQFPISFVTKTTHDNMVLMVDTMLELHKQVQSVNGSQEKEHLENQIETTDAAIDRLVYDLYGLTDEEITAIESEGKKTW